MVDCPCGTSRSFTDCCEPYLKGKRHAETAATLMRTRYTAYTRHHIDYLLSTYDPDQQYLFDRETTLDWARRSKWLSLEIRDCRGGTLHDDEGTVEFVAWYVRGERTHRHHEVSSFRKVDERWYYVDGRYPSASALLGAESRRTTAS
ncbi:MAG: YchJ family protein [Planctomycetes bacterium]|nr:YchJ family protein [Planctomycetota bacterium]